MRRKHWPSPAPRSPSRPRGVAAGRPIRAVERRPACGSAARDANDPIAGTLVSADASEIVIRHEDPRVGAVHVHLPRFRLQRGCGDRLMRILTNTTSPYARIARIALGEKGFDLSPTEVVNPWADDAGLLALNPAARVPTPGARQRVAPHREPVDPPVAREDCAVAVSARRAARHHDLPDRPSHGRDRRNGEYRDRRHADGPEVGREPRRAATPAARS